jgi:adenine-specific DNA methylase
MPDSRRIRLSEDDAMERGVRCPNCGSYTSFADIIATGWCRRARGGDCETRLGLDLVVEQAGSTVDTSDDE